jgi:hypothetical protein
MTRTIRETAAERVARVGSGSYGGGGSSHPVHNSASKWCVLILEVLALGAPPAAATPGAAVAARIHLHCEHRAADLRAAPLVGNRCRNLADPLVVAGAPCASALTPS